MKAPLNTDNWSGSIRRKAIANTNDWNGFISKEDAIKLSQNCQCITTPCNCGVIKEKVYDNSNKDTVTTPISNTFGDMNKKAEDEYSKKVRKQYIMYVLIAVAGYFAYKKFKK
jgi:hypothetical protein